MLSITDLLDFIDLDRETVQVVNRATRLPEEEAIAIASELLRTHRGIYLLHEMFKDQIAEAASACEVVQERSLRKAYAYFARKYPIPHML
ncbi:hypothetical protein [Zoogloea sp.]|uniref:hypothetical protein n=1 Tax=Zoogloea sp. TaxID=49181 RepID=UPI002614CE1B|nr:hypothetical protein [uncultured Zoogloea sp.]